MTAGRGIVHSERTAAERRVAASRLIGIQCWLALPTTHEESEPGFVHHAAAELPVRDAARASASASSGAAYSAARAGEDPVGHVYAEAVLAPGASLPLDPDYEERGDYIVAGEIDIAGRPIRRGPLMVFNPGDRISILAITGPR